MQQWKVMRFDELMKSITSVRAKTDQSSNEISGQISVYESEKDKLYHRGRLSENIQMKLLQILCFLKVHGKQLEIASRERIESLYEAFTAFNSILKNNTADNSVKLLLNELLELCEKRWNIHENDQNFDLNKLEIFDEKNFVNNDIKSISEEKNENLPETIQNKVMEKISEIFDDCKIVYGTSCCLTNYSSAIADKENMPMKEELSIVEKKFTKFLSNDGQNMKIINWSNAIKFIESLYFRRHEPFLSQEEEKTFQNIIKIMNNNVNRMDFLSQMTMDMLNTFISALLEKKTTILNPNLYKEMKSFLKKHNKENNMENVLPMMNGNEQKGSELSIRTTSVSTKSTYRPVILLTEKTNYATTKFDKFNSYRELDFPTNVFKEAETVTQPVFYRETVVEKSSCGVLIGIKGILLKKLAHLTTCKIILKPVVNAMDTAGKLIHIIMEFRANLFKLEIYSFNQIEEHNLQPVNWIFYYPIKLNEQLLENVTSSKDLTKIQGVIKGALDSLYYCKELLLSGILPDNHDILEKKRNIHFRLMCCDQEKETDDFNNYELVICEKTVMKKCISCKMLKNTLNQHVFSALEARYKFIRNFSRTE
ncbi:hypothetical protein T4C_11734 [Trichinella pseudospiralis]|uniref:K Homology domain-containing protein n=2 Tax=Trichinella pseudospiralis TaxID=6337 RepID=A0A0V1KGD6_TRIPS|nr:hypothetical protein T4C_11734 [Trichinella pseudospiralis]